MSYYDQGPDDDEETSPVLAFLTVVGVVCFIWALIFGMYLLK